MRGGERVERVGAPGDGRQHRREVPDGPHGPNDKKKIQRNDVLPKKMRQPSLILKKTVGYIFCRNR